jgi:hypothetical protein
VPPEKIVLSLPLLTVAEREVTVVMNWRTEPEMSEGRRLIVVRGEVNLDLSMPPKRTVPDVASEKMLEMLSGGISALPQLTNIVQINGIQAAVDLAT